MRGILQHGDPFRGHAQVRQFQVAHVLHADDGPQVVVGHVHAVRQHELPDRRHVLDDLECGRSLESLRELQVFEFQAGERRKPLRRGLVRPEFQAFELRECGDLRQGVVAVVAMGQRKRFQVREGRDKGLQAGVAQLAAAVAQGLQAGPALEVLQWGTGHAGADVAEGFQLMQRSQ